MFHVSFRGSRVRSVASVVGKQSQTYIPTIHAGEFHGDLHTMGSKP